MSVSLEIRTCSPGRSKSTCTSCWNRLSTSTVREFSIAISNPKTCSSLEILSNWQISAHARVCIPWSRNLLEAAIHRVHLYEVVQSPGVPYDWRVLWFEDGYLGLRLCSLRNDRKVSAVQWQRRTRPDS